MKKIIIVITLGILFFSCNDNSYESPEPGIIEIRLSVERGKYTEFGVFKLSVESIKIETPSGAYSDIYDNIKAIRDNSDSYDIFSSGEFVIGQMYLPSQNYSGILLTLSPPDSMSYNGNIVKINTKSDFDALVSLPLNAAITSGEKTIVTIDMKMDSILSKKVDYFEYNHSYSIKSITRE